MQLLLASLPELPRSFNLGNVQRLLRVSSLGAGHRRDSDAVQLDFFALSKDTRKRCIMQFRGIGLSIVESVSGKRVRRFRIDP